MHSNFSGNKDVNRAWPLPRAVRPRLYSFDAGKERAMTKHVVTEKRSTSAGLAFFARGYDAPEETAQTIARLVGPIFCAIGLGMLLSSASYQELARQFLTGYTFIYFSGILLLLAGLIILNAHHVWTRDWRLAITLIGWLFACGGTFRLIAPQFVSQIGSVLLLSSGFFQVAGIVFLVLGAFLTFKGYAP
jgi:predicted membrane channel-forming protein YqfA (hemolysin III family)